MKPIKAYFSLLFGFLLWTSCTKTVTVPLHDSAGQVTIEGVITTAQGPYQVKMTESVVFSALNSYPPITGAQMYITDQTAGLTDTLSETAAGIYETHNIAGISGHTYQLSVYSAGLNYGATTTMPDSVALDSVSFEHESHPGGTSIEAIPNFQDPSGVPNYYTFTESVNGKRIKSTYVFDDRLSDGKYITESLRTDSNYIKVGDQVELVMNCVDKNIWSYFNVLFLVNNSSAIQSVAPSNPTSNISNNALGFFSANTSQSISVVAK